MENKIITLRSWAGKVKEYHFQPLKQKNGLPWPFVKKVRYDGQGNSEMIVTDKERESEDYKYFIPEDMDIVVTDGVTFDLSDPLQKNIWLSISESDLIVPSRDSRDANGNLRIDGGKTRYGIAELWIDIPGEESEKSVSKIQKINKAWTFIGQDTINGRLTKCKILGKHMYNAPESDIADYLYKRAEKSPDEVIELYTSSDMQLRLLLIDSKEKGVIFKKDGMYMYGEAILGATDEAVMIFFKNPLNKKVLDQIKYVTYPEYAPTKVLEEIMKDPDEDKREEDTPKKTETKKK